MSVDWFGQSEYRVRLEWGRRGARVAAERGDILVIVDVLSFSTLATIAVSRGVVLYPCAMQEEVEATALRVGAKAAVRKREVPGPREYSLSPVTFLSATTGERVAIASPNGATCCRYGSKVPALFVGGIVNAEATANAVVQALANTSAGVTLLACGERWTEPSEDGELRFAIEDLWGAGAVAAHLPSSLNRSPEVRVAEAAFRTAVAEGMESNLLTCGSGVELVQRGFPEDVCLAAGLNGYAVVPTLIEGERLEAHASA